MDLSTLQLLSAILVGGGLYLGLIFLPWFVTPRAHRYRGTVHTLCCIALFVPPLWLVAFIFAALPPGEGTGTQAQRH